MLLWIWLQHITVSNCMLLEATLCYSSPFSSLFSIFMTTKLHTVATTRLSPTIILVGWTSQQKIITVGVTESRETIETDVSCHTLYCRYVDPASPWSTALNYSPYNSFGSTGHRPGRGLYACLHSRCDLVMPIIIPDTTHLASATSRRTSRVRLGGGGREIDKFFCPRVVY